MDLVEDNRKFHTENEDLRNKLQLREKMTFKEPFYYQDGDKTPFCPACWELKNSAIHLIFQFNRADAVRWDCKVCQNIFLDMKDRSVARTHHFEPPRSEWG